MDHYVLARCILVVVPVADKDETRAVESDSSPVRIIFGIDFTKVPVAILVSNLVDLLAGLSKI